MENLKWDITGLRRTDELAIGETAETIVAAKLMAKGFIISEPKNTTGYDLMSDYNGIFNRIQVKSTTKAQQYRGRDTYYRAKTKSTLGNYSVLALYVYPTDTLYFFPCKIVKHKYMVNIPAGKTSKFDEYKENYKILKEAH